MIVMNETEMMHGMDWDGEDLTGFVLSEKFDGCRAFWDGTKLWSRGGMNPALPAEWVAELPDMPLDCELYDNVGGLYRCGAALRYGRFAPTMRLMVFDAPAAIGDYSERMRTVGEAIAGSSIAVVTPLTICHNTSHAIQLMHEIQGRGGEGVMARAPGIQYTPGRTRDLLKVKYSFI
jgi:DNA ligase-1